MEHYYSSVSGILPAKHQILNSIFAYVFDRRIKSKIGETGICITEIAILPR